MHFIASSSVLNSWRFDYFRNFLKFRIYYHQLNLNLWLKCLNCSNYPSFGQSFTTSLHATLPSFFDANSPRSVQGSVITSFLFLLRLRFIRGSLNKLAEIIHESMCSWLYILRLDFAAWLDFFLIGLTKF